MEPGSCTPGCWDGCQDYFGTGAPCGIAAAPDGALPIVELYASYRETVAVGRMSLDALAGLYADSRDDRRELIEAWVMLERVFSARPSEEGGD